MGLSQEWSLHPVYELRKGNIWSNVLFLNLRIVGGSITYSINHTTTTQPKKIRNL